MKCVNNFFLINNIRKIGGSVIKTPIKFSDDITTFCDTVCMCLAREETAGRKDILYGFDTLIFGSIYEL